MDALNPERHRARHNLRSHTERESSRPSRGGESGIRLGFAQTGDAVAFLPLAAFFKEANALEALENIAFATRGGNGAQTTML
jgi:hypothetical protein